MMRILVVDDCPLYLDAAKAQLSQHEVTLVQDYGTAEALVGPYWRDALPPELADYPYDVVLTDLMLPADNKRGVLSCEAKKEYVGMEMPIGIFLALLAAKNGAKYVGVLTDLNHHHHPASACIDRFNMESSTEPDVFTVCGARFTLCNGGIRRFHKNDLATKCAFGDTNTVDAKDWRIILSRLFAE